MKQIKEVLAAYGIKSITAEAMTDSFFHVKTRNEQYVLRKSSLTSEKVNQWENVFHEASRKKLTGILPVYKTTNGQLYVQSNETIYYLTPWVDKKTRSIKKIYRCIGSIHHQSKQTFTVNKEEITRSFLAYKKYCDSLQATLPNHLQMYEAKRFMSPFELQVCMHYRDVRAVIHKISSRLEQFINTEDQFDWSYSLCHHNLTFSKILHSSDTWIIDWEHATYGHAIMDLVSLFGNEVIYFDAPTAQLINKFNYYMSENKLLSSELLLLTIYLLDPTNYMKVLSQYDHHRSSATMVDFVKQLQGPYRLLLFGLAFTNFIEKEYETITLDDLEI